jgi:hypothetical protein
MGQRNQSSGLGSELAMLGTDVDNKRRDAQEPRTPANAAFTPRGWHLYGTAVNSPRRTRATQYSRRSAVIAEHVRQKVKFKS